MVASNPFVVVTPSLARAGPLGFLNDRNHVPHSRVGVAHSWASAVATVRRFERMIVQVSGHYVSLEQLTWLRRIVREERNMLEA